VSTGAHEEPATELAEILRVHVTPEIESIDRMHLNVSRNCSGKSAWKAPSVSSAPSVRPTCVME
jgi:hypothetical protein